MSLLRLADPGLYHRYQAASHAIRASFPFPVAQTAVTRASPDRVLLLYRASRVPHAIMPPSRFCRAPQALIRQ